MTSSSITPTLRSYILTFAVDISHVLAYTLVHILVLVYPLSVQGATEREPMSRDYDEVLDYPLGRSTACSLPKATTAKGEDEVLDQPSFKSPLRLRDKHRNLGELVRLALQTNEDPLVLASEAGVSPSALIRALPRSFLLQFLPDAESLSVPDILLRLASNHALDVACSSVVGQELDARTMVSMAKDVLDRASVVGHKVAPVVSRVALNDESLAKLAELERAFMSSALPPGTIPQPFQTFHRVGNGGLSEEERQNRSQEGWAGPVLPPVRDLDFDKDT